MNQQEVATLLRAMKAAWPEVTVTEDSLKVWGWATQDLSLEQAEAALGTLVLTSKWPPKPAELRERIATVAVSGVPWEEAWAELIRTIRSYGPHIYAANGGYIPPYRHPDTDELLPGRPAWPGWSSPEVEAAVNHIGYEEARLVDPDALSILRAQFRDAYESSRRRRIEAAQVGGQAAIDRLRSLSGSGPASPGQDRSDSPRPIAEIVQNMGAR